MKYILIFYIYKTANIFIPMENLESCQKVSTQLGQDFRDKFDSLAPKMLTINKCYPMV